MSVDLPAPFSPSRQWISPGSTTRSMWSLATRVPNRLVIPRSSSFMVPILVTGVRRTHRSVTDAPGASPGARRTGSGEAGEPDLPTGATSAREVRLDRDGAVDDAGD